MNKPCFLIDECTDPDLATALQQVEPLIDVIRVGDVGAPARGTLDPELLVVAERIKRVLISRDRSSMPGHLVDHFAAGWHTAGVMLWRDGFSLGRLVQEIVNHWATTTADDWIDRTVYIP
jgi:hypothetical protein